MHLDKHGRDAELSLREVRGQFESAFSNAPIGMALVDMDGRWLQVNNALCRITGHAERELKAKTLRSLTHPDDIDLDVSLLRQLLDGRIPSYQVEKRCIHAWGQFVWMMMTVSLVRDRRVGRFIGSCSFRTFQSARSWRDASNIWWIMIF